MDVIHKTTAIMTMMAQMFAGRDEKSHPPWKRIAAPTGEAAILLQ